MLGFVGSGVVSLPGSLFRVGRGRYAARRKVVVSGRLGYPGRDHREARFRAVRGESVCWAFYPLSLPGHLLRLIVGDRSRANRSHRVCSRRSSFRPRVRMSRARVFWARPIRLTSPRFPRPAFPDMPTRPSFPHPRGVSIIQRVRSRDRLIVVQANPEDSLSIANIMASPRSGARCPHHEKSHAGKRPGADITSGYSARPRGAVASPGLRFDRRVRRIHTRSPGLVAPR